MATYSKSKFPNVFLAKCEEQHEKGETITMQTKYGSEHEAIVFNLVFKQDGFFYYSVVRADGYNAQERAKRRAELYESAAHNAGKRAMQWHEKGQEGAEFLKLAEPIKVGHHSEKRHRALIERNQRRMTNMVKEYDRQEEMEELAKYWESKTDIINLSMPESLEYWEFKLEQAKQRHADLKSGKVKRDHSYSLTYAKKDVNNAETNLKIATLLWREKEQ
jgi:hypothetical protein